MKQGVKKLFRKLECWYKEADEDLDHTRKNRHKHNIHKSHKGRIRQFLKRIVRKEVNNL